MQNTDFQNDAPAGNIIARNPNFAEKLQNMLEKPTNETSFDQHHHFHHHTNEPVAKRHQRQLGLISGLVSGIPFISKFLGSIMKPLISTIVGSPAHTAEAIAHKNAILQNFIPMAVSHTGLAGSNHLKVITNAFEQKRHSVGLEALRNQEVVLGDHIYLPKDQNDRTIHKNFCFSHFTKVIDNLIKNDL